MIWYSLGDVVEITELVSLDKELGIKVGDVGKVVNIINHPDSQYIQCYNPKWDHVKLNGLRQVVTRQIRKVK